MMDFYIAADPAHIKRERQKARELRKSQWWRQRLAERQCHYCEKRVPMEALTMDHLIPVGRGGRTTKGNVVAACKDCNSLKKHHTPAELKLRELADQQ